MQPQPAHMHAPAPQTAWRLGNMRDIHYELTALPHNKVSTNLSGFIEQFAWLDAPGPRTAGRATYTLWEALLRALLTMVVFIILAFILDTQTALSTLLEPLPFVLALVIALLLVMGSTFIHWWNLWRIYRVHQQTLMNDFRVDLLPHIKSYNSALKNPHSHDFERALTQLVYAMLWFQSRNPLTPYGVYRPTAEVAVEPRSYEDPNNAYSPAFIQVLNAGGLPQVQDLLKFSTDVYSPPQLLRSLGAPFERVLIRAGVGWLVATVAVFMMSLNDMGERGFLFTLINSVFAGSFIGAVLLAQPAQRKVARQQIRMPCANQIGTVSLGALHQALRIELLPVVDAYARGEISAEAVRQAHALFMGRYPLS